MKPTLFSVYLRSSLPMFLGPLVALQALIAANSLRDVHVNRSDDVTLTVYFVALTIGLLGTGLALGLSHVPSWRTSLLHRGVPATRLFDACVLATLVPSLFAVIAGLAIPTLVLRSFGQNGALVSLRSTLELLAIGTSVLAGVGLGAWLSSLRGSVESLVIRGILGSATVIGVGLFLMTPWRDTFAAPVLPYVLFQVAVLAVGVASARRHHLSANDPDRPPSSAYLRWAGPTSALASATCLLLVLPYGQQEIALSSMRYPSLVETRDSQGIELLTPIDDQRFQIVDPTHAPRGGIRTHDELASTHFQWSYGSHRQLKGAYASAGLYDRRGSRDIEFGSAWSAVAFSAFTSAYLVKETGELIVVNFGRPDPSSGGRQPASATLVARPDGREFSNQADVLGVIAGIGATELSGEGAVILGDPIDGTLHRLDLTNVDAPKLEPLVFPEGDRYRGWRAVAHPIGSKDPQQRVDLDGHRDAYVVIGEKGRYAIGSDFSLSPADDLELGYFRRDVHDHRTTITSTGDALYFSVIVTDEGGTEIIRHDYAPRTTRERCVAAVLGGIATLRPLPLLALGFRLEPRPGELFVADSFFDPRVRGGRGALWIGLALLLAVTLSIAARKRLARLGAEPSRWRIWAACYVAFGPATWLAYRLLEADRAYAKEPVVEESSTARALVISA